ncbi:MULTISPECIES: FliM/FliN family flagellar motor C-terminal domain-containing protein [unclassified Paracoccus (in: a-proteobacteria)]|uniref:FliM/FliN family flagellar motor C-terminal domain-containing protein n=1 Tax=unclassified Paracoccus (in: a-proteobacteria) TaxID=2688777 RepID=UPI0015FFEEBE|nr:MULTISPECIES: FliM/FliN family flagellar motor C-terminal domain-containing protein [unclassified Paracoccus (in: a-proteobacteria)]MBB1490308.1 FliM/FliN family flagellar motor switch protein [Paracoccus sp. MC1854]MBB1498766.1 FliM/FliN family flagellar motor switch protein [Paracoccus sp. MC1862]QQO43926.1 FliM/FliN family flagellar motor switch protein [Paracoccus sp. MC1862]
MEPEHSLIPTEQIQIEIAIRIGRTRLSVADLARLQADDVLPLEQDTADGVEICIGEKVVARGELVEHGGEGRLAVRILGPAA